MRNDPGTPADRTALGAANDGRETSIPSTDKRNAEQTSHGVSSATPAPVPCDEKTFFESFYRASVRGKPDDRSTIASVTEPESRFHYNAVENAIIRALLRRNPPPRGAGVDLWRMFEQRAARRMLDIGSGSGHWIDFFRDVFFVKQVTGIEITQRMSKFLEEKYAGNPDVTVHCADAASPSFLASLPALEGSMDYVSAIGVMFHIVDDDRWRQAMRNLAAALKPGGLLIVGGDFGATTRNVQFHRVDEFAKWQETLAPARATGTDAAPESLRVNKRVRSMADWVRIAGDVHLEVLDLVRADLDPLVATPENDVLVLRRPSATAHGSAPANA